jgi:DNA polymerase III delta subunit
MSVYLVLGEDTQASREKLNAFVARFLKSGKSTAVFGYNDQDFNEQAFNDLFKGTSLFHDRAVYVLKHNLVSAVIAPYHIGNLEKYASSPDVFIFYEYGDALAADRRKLVEKIAEEIYGAISAKTKNPPADAVKKSPAKKGKGVSEEWVRLLFRICDAFVLRERSNAWILYQEAVAAGVSEKEIFFKIVWAVKSLLIIKSGGGRSLKGFVAAKYKKAAPLFGGDELKKISSDLLELYHKDRYGLSELGTGMEKMILKI